MHVPTVTPAYPLLDADSGSEDSSTLINDATKDAPMEVDTSTPIVVAKNEDENKGVDDVPLGPLMNKMIVWLEANFDRIL